MNAQEKYQAELKQSDLDHHQPCGHRKDIQYMRKQSRKYHRCSHDCHIDQKMKTIPAATDCANIEYLTPVGSVAKVKQCTE